MEYVHNLSLAKVCQKEILNLQGIFTEDRERLVKQYKTMKLEKLFNIVDYLAEVERKMRYTRHPWILLEMLDISEIIIAPVTMSYTGTGFLLVL